MTTVATIAAKLMLDAKDYVSGIGSASDATEKFWRGADGRLRDVNGRFVGAGAAASEFGQKMDTIAGKMQKVGAAMTLGLTVPIALSMKKAIELSSAYDESLNKVNVVFEDNSKIIEEWSKDSATAIGLSQGKALEAAGTFGNLFTAQGMGTKEASKMSTAIVDLSADLASFNNAAPEDVLLALRSGLSGEIEPLKKYGVAMNEALMKTTAMSMGLGDNVQALTESEKIQVRYAIIMSQTTKAQGDFARTSGGLANQQRILNAQYEDALRLLGDNIRPMILQIVIVLNKLLTSFNNASPSTQKFILGLLLFVAAAGPVTTAIGTIIKVILFFSAGGGGATAVAWITTVLIPALYSFGAAAISAMLPILPILALVAAAALLVYMVWKNWDELTVTISQLWELTKMMFVSIGESATDTIAGIMKRFTDFRTKVITIFNSVRNAFNSVFSGISRIASSVFGAISNAISKLVGWIKSLASALANIKLPSALTPGSPTPFEMGLRGINSEMNKLSTNSIPQMNKSFVAPSGITSVGGGGNVSYTDNRRFAGGMSRGELQTALDSKFSALAGAL